MTLTRANVEVMLISRVGKLFDLISLDGTTVDGTNVDLNDPIASALLRLDYAVASIVLVSDADIASVSTDDYQAVLDLAELRALENWLGNNTLVNFRLGPRSESFSDLLKTTEARVARLKEFIPVRYGLEETSLSMGRLHYDFAEHYETTDDL